SSTITALTNLPFANGAPIVQLSQNVQILDKNGEVVGTLNTPFAPANATGSSVTTSTPAAPLVIADGSHQIYEAFIGDLNEATTYELGLRGTADSILDLGALGQITVKGIKLDVKTSLAGLQGLKKVDFVSALSILTPPNSSGLIASLVVIHNPSQLTLVLGDLVLNCGVDTTPANYAGYATISNLTLAPGDNTVLSTVDLLANAAGSNIATLAFYGSNVTLALYGFEGTSTNPALNAGLQSMVSSTIVLGGLPDVHSAPAYDLNWTMKCFPTTVDDGQCDMTATFNNPYFASPMHFLEAVDDPNEFPGSQPITSYIAYGLGGSTEGTHMFLFQNNFQYALQPGQSTTMTFKMLLSNSSFTTSYRPTLVNMVAKAATGVLPFYVYLTPVVTIGANPQHVNPYWALDYIYGGLNSLNMAAGTDAQYILDWFDKAFAPATTVATTSTATTTAVTFNLPHGGPRYPDLYYLLF
ncbi:hypothetical protein BGZ58_001436, partial [Dissophora ornata]